MKRILLLTQKPPYPSVDGGCKATASLIEMLSSAGFGVEIFSLYSDKHPLVKEFYLSSSLQWEFHYVDVRIRARTALPNLFSSLPYTVARYYHPALQQQIRHKLATRQYDWIICDGLYMTPYLMGLPGKVRVVYRAHNIESQLWIEQARQEKQILRKLYYYLLAGRTAALEKKFAGQVSLIFTVSCSDAEYFRQYNPRVFFFPPHAEIKEAEKTSCERKKMRIGFIASYNWAPNREGLKRLLQWWRKVPSEKYHLIVAGRYDPVVMQENISFLGYVEHLEEFYRQVDVIVIPIFSGGGIKMKALEAMSYGKPIVATSKGMEGLPVKEYEHYLPFQDPDSFLSALKMAEDNEIIQKLVERNYTLLRSVFAKESLTDTLQKILSDE